jgi:hypothetical protein
MFSRIANPAGRVALKKERQPLQDAFLPTGLFGKITFTVPN